MRAIEVRRLHQVAHVGLIEQPAVPADQHLLAGIAEQRNHAVLHPRPDRLRDEPTLLQFVLLARRFGRGLRDEKIEELRVRARAISTAV